MPCLWKSMWYGEKLIGMLKLVNMFETIWGILSLLGNYAI